MKFIPSFVPLILARWAICTPAPQQYQLICPDLKIAVTLSVTDCAYDLTYSLI